MKTKLSPKFWCALTLFSLVGQIAWVVENMYLNVFIYKMFNASASDISLMVAASAVAATLTTVFVGALSDKIGKRKLFICAGYILWGISILGFVFVRTDVIDALFGAVTSSASIGVSLVIILDCVMTFFGSSANDAAFNAWLTDSTDATNRGAAEGINAMMPLIAILAVFGGFMAFDLNISDSWVKIFFIIGVAVILIGVLGIFIIKDAPTEKCETSYLRTVVHGFLPSTIKQNGELYLSLICFIVFNIAIQIFMPYLIIYYEVSLSMANYVFIMAPAIIIASIVTAIWGRIYDKKGFAFSGYISLFSLCAGFIVLYFFKSVALVFVGSLLMMCGYLSGMAVFGARIRDLTPIGKAGMFQGVRIFSQVLVPGVIGPYIGKTVLSDAQVIVNNDGTESFVPNEKIFMAALIVGVITIIFLWFIIKMQKPRLNKDLRTPFEDENDHSWNDYPRPQFKRDSYFSLCGDWNLSVKRGENTRELGTIRVPFPPESRLSGVEYVKAKDEQYIYSKSFVLNEGFNVGRVLINFGAVDQKATLYVNDKFVGEHVGGYLPFSFDITDALVDGQNKLVLQVCDELDTELAYGKQTDKRGGMWYTPVSGIWQPVWLESVPQEYIKELKISNTLGSVTISTIGGKRDKTLKVNLGGVWKSFVYSGDKFTLIIDEPDLWTPDNPYLYDFEISDGTDVVSSYFALRMVSIEQRGDTSYICLNGEPVFSHGLLDQGYYPEGIYLPATPVGYLFDIISMKQMGFNMLRKHIKIEPEIFYYYCDRYGMLVFQDMVNSGKYSYLKDTVLPTIGLNRGITHKATSFRREMFETNSRETVSLLYNHPCVVYYTIFNEGWGQYDADRIYRELKAFDPSRVYDATSGWFVESDSDVVSEHIYFKKIKLKKNPERPLVLSEFGGYSCKIYDHSFNLDKTYGYRFFDDTKKFEDALCKLYKDEVIPQIKKNGLCATVLTQVSDVEDETNGLLTYDRQKQKASTDVIRALSNDLYKAFDEQLNK